MGKSNYKKSCFENCKKKYIKIQQNKFGLCLFLIFSSVLVDFFFWLSAKIFIMDNKCLFWLFQ